MPKKTEKKTEPLMTRFDYDTNPNVPQKNPQAVMIKQIPPMDYDDVGPKVVDMPPPKMDYDSPLPMPAPMPLPPPPVMPPVMDKGPMNLPLAPQPPLEAPVPLTPGVMSCPECGEGAEIDEEDAADVLECPKCGFEIYSCMMGKTAVSPALETRWQEHLKNINKPSTTKDEPFFTKKEPSKPKAPVTNIFWRNNGSQVGNEKADIFQTLLKDLAVSNNKYRDALYFFQEFKKQTTYPTQEEADKAGNKLLQLSVQPNPNLDKMKDIVQILLSTEPASKMKTLADKVNPGGIARRQKLSEVVKEAAKKLKEHKQ